MTGCSKKGKFPRTGNFNPLLSNLVCLQISIDALVDQNPRSYLRILSAAPSRAVSAGRPNRVSMNLRIDV